MACKKGEYYCNDEQKCKPIPAGHKVLPDGELVKEGTSIIQGRTSSKKVSYRGPTGDHERNEKGWIKGSHYKKKKTIPAGPQTKTKKVSQSKKPKEKLPWKPKTPEERKAILRKFDSHKKTKAGALTNKLLSRYRNVNEEDTIDEGSSIIQGRTSSKKVSYRGPTSQKSKPKKSVSYRGEKDERIPRKNRHGVENKSARYASQLHRLRPRSERVSEEEVKESSLNRIRSKSTKGGMAIISAARGDKSKKENKKRDTKLGKRFPGSTRVKGKYTEKDDKTGKERTVSEPSRVVTSGKLGKRKFAKKVKKAGKDYGQDSVLIQKKPKGSATLHATRKGGLGKDKRIKAGKLRPGRSNEYGHSEVKGKKFTYESSTMERTNGINLCVSLVWRGRYYTPQIFFPSLKKPSRKDVNDSIQKVYPGARVNAYYEHPIERNQPIIKLPEENSIAESLIRHMRK